MKYCSKCNIQFNIAGNYCEKCGSLLTEVTPSFCPECGEKLQTGARFCNACGTRINGSVSGGSGPVNTVPPVVQQPEPVPVKRSIPKQAVIGVAVLLIALLGGGGYYFLTHNDKTVSGSLTGKSQTQKIDSSKDANKGSAGNSANNQNVPPIKQGAVSKAYHSSADKEGSYIHSASLAVDGRTESCWSEGVPGLGIGENIVIHFNGTYRVSGLNIWIGHQKSEALFYQNARPTRIRIEGSDGSSVAYVLKDTFGAQRVEFKKPINTNLIKIVVDQAVPGNKYEDTCIAEVSFF